MIKGDEKRVAFLIEVVQIAAEALAGMIDQNPNVIPMSKEWRERLVMARLFSVAHIRDLIIPFLV